jgi:transcriptional regulator with XRE-family HTH domain
MIDHETGEPGGNEAAPLRAGEAVGPSSDRRSSDRRANDQPPSTGSHSADTFGSSPIGEYLRRQRALRGISIEELSSITRIPLRSLERLENGEFDDESDGFVRGFVRTVAIAIGLDADDTVSRILKEPSAGVWERHQSGRRAKQGFVAVVLAVAGVIAFLAFQAGWRLLVGSSADEPGREVVIWRDPVRSLAEATGVEVDAVGEIDPASLSRER